MVIGRIQDQVLTPLEPFLMSIVPHLGAWHECLAVKVAKMTAGRIAWLQLASETLILREEMLRTKTDSRGMDAALAAAQEQAHAALRRARACEEAFEPVLAEMESLRVAAMAAADDAATGETAYCQALQLGWAAGRKEGRKITSVPAA